MFRAFSFLTVALIALAACNPGPGAPPLGADGRPVPTVYRISDSELPRIQIRVLDAVNTLRASSGATALQLNSQLSAAAATHSRDMSRQARAWHFGSDGSSPVDRVQRSGYRGSFRGELVSETFESELETVNAWMTDRDARGIILDREARELGFAFHQDANGKLWWTMVTGAPGTMGAFAGLGN
jgi:uncharacterized protein YkwD